MAQFRGAALALVVCALAIFAVQVLPWRGDFAPFLGITGPEATTRQGIAS